MAGAPQVDVRRMDGTPAGTRALDAATFGIEPNVAVMHQVVTAQLAAARAGTQSTLTRAEVRGGGSKPWRQKGTGRARQGSTRSPHWTGGGVALGPKPRSYRQRTPKKMVALALRSALSDRAAEGRVAVVEDWSFDRPRTKDALAALAAIGVEGRALVVLERTDETAALSFRNIPEVQVIDVAELNAYDVLCNDWVVFTTRTLPGGTSVAPAGAGPAAVTTEAVVAEGAETGGGPSVGAAIAGGTATPGRAAADEPAPAGEPETVPAGEGTEEQA